MLYILNDTVSRAVYKQKSFKNSFRIPKWLRIESNIVHKKRDSVSDKSQVYDKLSTFALLLLQALLKV